MQAEYGGCTCEVNSCCGGPAYDTPEGMEKRQKGGRILRMLSLVQIGFSALSIIFGIVSSGFALTNPNYPQINGYAIVTGILVLIGGIYGRKATAGGNLEEVDRRARAYVMVHYVMNVMCITFSGLQFIITGWAISECFSSNQDLANKCRPYASAIEGFGAVVVVIGIVLNVTCIIGTVFFCVYARVLGFTNQYEEINTMRREIRSLRQQVAVQQGEIVSGDQYSKSYSSFGYKSP